MRIILDGMGGDNAPAAIVQGAIDAAKEIKHEICIIGDEELIKAELKKNGYNPEDPSAGTITTVHSTEVISNDEAPVKAVRSKKDSSITKGMNMVKDEEADCFISAGSTGALLAGGLFIMGRIKGIDRPCIASIYPILGQDKPSILLDAGANAECKPGNLLEFGVMGSIYMEKVIGRENPTVGLVNLGAEEHKGSTLTKTAHQLLKQSETINFVGNVEAREVPFGASDVYVADGFVGNTILKLTEGMALNMLKMVKHKFTDGLRATVGALFLKNKLKEMKKEFDYSEYGGAPILGVKKPIVKMHGSADAKSVKNSILKAIPYVEENVCGIISDAVSELERIENGDV